MIMLTGKVLKRFRDKDTKKVYAPEGEVDKEPYTNKVTRYPSVYIADKDRYEKLEAKGYVEHGKLVEDKKNRIEED